MNDTDAAIARKEELGQTGGDGGAVHDPEAIALAWERTFAFFAKHLKGSGAA
jgi:dienelactone hydrolase